MLGRQLAELQEKLGRMEAELTIVSEESRELADSLEEREMELMLKVGDESICTIASRYTRLGHHLPRP
jgi:hypothetical protein